MLSPHEANYHIHKGFQWALFNATLVAAYDYNGSPCVRVDD